MKTPTCVFLLLSATHNSNKQNSTVFQDQLVINIDNAFTLNEKLILLVDYNSRLDSLESSTLETVVLTYDLHIENHTIPTRVNLDNTTKSLVDFIISDCSSANNPVVCDSLVKSDHFASLKYVKTLFRK